MNQTVATFSQMMLSFHRNWTRLKQCGIWPWNGTICMMNGKRPPLWASTRLKWSMRARTSSRRLSSSTEICEWVLLTRRLCGRCSNGSHTHRHAHMHTRTHAHTHMPTHAVGCMHAHARTHASTHAHTRTQTHTQTHTHIHTHRHTHVHTHTHTHTHAHTPHTHIHTIWLACSSLTHPLSPTHLPTCPLTHRHSPTHLSTHSPTHLSANPPTLSPPYPHPLTHPLAHSSTSPLTHSFTGRVHECFHYIDAGRKRTGRLWMPPRWKWTDSGAPCLWWQTSRTRPWDGATGNRFRCACLSVRSCMCVHVSVLSKKERRK